MPVEKARLDTLVYTHGLAPSREMAQRYILAGEVMVDGVLQTKPGTKIPTTALITLKQAAPFVSRGGEKLEGALAAFGLDVMGWICADVGASTGGFTDCLLQRGAEKVYALDVGYGQLAHKLRVDARVVSMERTNVRYVEKLDDPIRLVVMDVSFISILLLLPTIRRWLTPDGEIVSLIKPQFEAGRADVGKGGIVKDPAVHRRVLNDILTQSQALGYGVRGLVQSSITGSKGNIEFLVWLGLGQPIADLAPLIDGVF